MGSECYGLSRAAAVLPKIDTREPVRLDRQSPLDETCQTQRLHPCSVHLPGCPAVLACLAGLTPRSRLVSLLVLD